MKFDFPSLVAMLVIGDLLACSPPASAEAPWMSEEAMRADFVGKALQGYFRTGGTWTGSYDKEGRLDVCEGTRCVTGRWHFRDGAFCLLSGPPHWPLTERRGAVTKVGANCYVFHLVRPRLGQSLGEGGLRPESLRHSRGWRQGESSTCEEQPTV